MKNSALYFYPFAILLLLLSLSYTNLVQLGFARFDDEWMLLNNSLVSISDLSKGYLYEVFTDINSLQYSPLNTLYYYIIYQINGFDAYWYHFSSLTLHVINSVLVFLLIKKNLVLFRVRCTPWLAHIISITWALLPINVETVTWISAAKILLFALFGLGSFYAFILAYTKRSYIWFLFSLVLYTLSFLAKEQSVLLVIAFAAFALLYDNESANKDLKRSLKYLTPLFLLSFVFGLVTIYAAVYGDGSHDFKVYPTGQRLVLGFYCLMFYMTNTIVPYDLHFHYPYPIKYGDPLPYEYYIWPVLFLIIVLILVKWIKQQKDKNFYWLCLAIFFGNLILSIQFFPLVRAAIAADRYMYLSSIGAVSMLAVPLNNYVLQSSSKFRKFSVLACFGLYILALVTYNNQLVLKWVSFNL